jgi:ketosteroid isomerase-like protein
LSDSSKSHAQDLTEPFDQALARTEAAAQQFVQGDSTGIMECWSHSDDVSIFGGGGGHARGCEQVRHSLEGGAGLFRQGQVSGHVEVDIIARGSSDDLSYSVAIERGEALMRGHDEPRPVTLRVTQIYRREADRWKIIHRHADALTTKA